MDDRTALQLAALAEIHAAFGRSGIEYWLFGGWAVDFYAGSVTRMHDDVDVAVWLEDHPRAATLLAADGWTHAPDNDEDGGTGYERGGVRLELTFLVRGDDGQVSIPLKSGNARWSTQPLGARVAELEGVTARVIALGLLTRGKSQPRDETDDAAKDR